MVQAGGQRHFIDFVYRQGRKKIPVEVKNYTDKTTFETFWNLKTEISKARIAKVQYGDDMEVYVFHFGMVQVSLTLRNYA
jgi:hypothetical protein